MDVYELIQRSPYFTGPIAARRIAAHARPRRFDAGELIMAQNEAGDGLYFVVSGQVHVIIDSSDGREQIFRTVTTGDSFNEIPVFGGGDNPVGAVAATDTHLFVVPRHAILEVLASDPKLALNALRVFAGRLRQVVALTEGFSFQHVDARLATLLLGHRAKHGDDPLHLTQQEIAAVVGTARQVVSRILSEFQAEGGVEMSRRSIRVLDPLILRARCE